MQKKQKSSRRDAKPQRQRKENLQKVNAKLRGNGFFDFDIRGALRILCVSAALRDAFLASLP